MKKPCSSLDFYNGGTSTYLLSCMLRSEVNTRFDLMAVVSEENPPSIGVLNGLFSFLGIKFEGLIRLCWGAFDIVYDVHVAGWIWHMKWITYFCFAAVYKYVLTYNHLVTFKY